MVVFLTWVLIPQPQAARLSVPNLIPYDDNLNRGYIVPSATNKLLDGKDSADPKAGTQGTSVDLGFAVGQHSCFLVLAGTDPTTATIKIKGSPNNSDFITLGSIAYVSATGETSRYKSITGSPTRYIKASWDSYTGAPSTTKVYVWCISGGN
jgi:hypothetical protein